MSSSYLVNIVANDFKDGQSIFQPFLLDQQSASVSHLTNGVKDAKISLVNGFKINGSMANGAQHAIEVNGNGH